MDEPAGLLRLLGDPTRLRLLRVLEREALNVSELTAILGLAQSGVSRHLGLLRDAGLVVEERAGTFTWYRVVNARGPREDSESAPAAGAGVGPRANEVTSAGARPSGGGPPSREALRRASPKHGGGEAPRAGSKDDSDRGALWTWLHEEFGKATPATRADDARLEEVRRLRKENFLQHGGGDERRQLVPGRSWAAWSRALGLLLPPLDVADLGCGEGYLTIEAARWARRVISIDRSRDVLTRARALATRRRVTNVVWKRGDLERLPIRDAAVDVALLSQALHHADQPALALAEAKRILRPDGRVLILDLREHGETWVRAKLGDRWLGFDDGALKRLLADAGFQNVVVRVGARRSGDPFVVLIASGVKAKS